MIATPCKHNFVGSRLSRCPECACEYSKTYRKEHPERDRRYHQARWRMRRELLVQLKDKPCADCKGKFPPVCMQFDHVRGQKTNNVAQMTGHTFRALKAEIAKCELVCSNCHAVRTEKRRSVKRDSLTGK